MATPNDFRKALEQLRNIHEDPDEEADIRAEIMGPLVKGVEKGEYVKFDAVISPETREEYADFFRKNFDFAVAGLKSGKIRSLNVWFVVATCWVGPGKNMVDNPAAAINPLLKAFNRTKVAADSAESDYAEKLAKAIKDSKVVSVEFPNDFLHNGVNVWKTTQKDRNMIMAALPSTVRKFSNDGYGAFGGFTNTDLQNLTDLMNRVSGIEVRLKFSTYGNPQFGPFDDKTYANFIKAAENSDGIYLDHPGFEYNPLFKQNGKFSEERQSMLERAVGAKAVETKLGGLVFDKNYLLKSQQRRTRDR